MTTPLEDAEREVARLRRDLDVYKKQRAEDIERFNKWNARHDSLQGAYAVAMKWNGELTDELNRLQIQQDLRDYKNPDAAELRRFREREPLVQALIIAAGELPSVRGFDAYPEMGDADVSTRVSKLAGVHDAAKAVRDFEVKP